MSNRVAKPSENWLSLQKRLHATAPSPALPRIKRQKSSPETPSASTSSNVVPSVSPSPAGDLFHHDDTVEALRSLILSPIPCSPDLPSKDRQPGPYIALDCEMVGVGPTGEESTLARVSVVNYFGTVLLDEFVRQKERVTDWRTQWSGIRARDMINAKHFEEVQRSVAELINGRILVGHAVQNDLKALMLSHSRAQIRDTQILAHRHGQSRSARPALRNLVRDMLGVKIQEGEHSSVTDARATMAIYRLHRSQWERGYAVIPIRSQEKVKEVSKGPRQRKSIRTKSVAKISMKASLLSEKRKGVSSGLSTVIRNRRNVRGGVGTKVKWWSQLAGTRDGSKGHISVVK
ncbi:ribonuclease H-like domain-containing protein [Russula earlei]|uniref:Ribonuclease H-like domain-containing protein n=1 Tax=Russula earlei TaxID=71964 RepID=A0ACC0U486_9AGAM|nr:ribonuclease H-like domain-containing protein [Russula earlei]